MRNIEVANESTRLINYYSFDEINLLIKDLQWFQNKHKEIKEDGR